MKRYIHDMCGANIDCYHFEEDPDGGIIKYEDVEPIIEAAKRVLNASIMSDNSLSEALENLNTVLSDSAQ